MIIIDMTFPPFIATAYTYYWSIVQEESFKCRGKLAERNQTRRRRERQARVCSEVLLSKNFIMTFACSIYSETRGQNFDIEEIINE